MSFLKGSTRNPKIGNTPAWVLSNILSLRFVRDPIFGVNVFNKLFLNDAKCQGYNFYCFWVIMGKPTGRGMGGGGKITPSSSTQIRINERLKVAVVANLKIWIENCKLTNKLIYEANVVRIHIPRVLTTCTLTN